MSNVAISVITVCYNSAKTIARTFDYILAQTQPPSEYIVIDGASKDNTLEIIKEYQEKFQAKGITFKWKSEPDNGIYYAMNKGIAMAKGDLIGIINSDDHYMEWTIDVVTKVAEAHSEIDVYHGLLRHTTNGALSRITGLPSSQLKNGMFEHPTCFVKKSVYEKYGNFNVSYRYVADYELMLRLKKEGCKFYLIEQVLADFDENGAGNSWKSQKEALQLKRAMGLISKKAFMFLYIKNRIHYLVRK